MVSIMNAGPNATRNADGRRARQVNNERGGHEGQKIVAVAPPRARNGPITG